MDLVLIVLFVAVITIVSLFYKLVMVLSVVESNKSASIGDIYQKSMRLVIPVFITFLVLCLLVWGNFMVFIVPGFIVSVLSMFYIFVIIDEGKQGFKAIGRSFDLMKGYAWTVFGYLFIVGLLGSLLVSIISAFFGHQTPTMHIDPSTHSISQAEMVQYFSKSFTGASSIIQSLLSLILGVFYMSFMYEMYLDLKKRLPNSEGNIPAVWKILAVVGWVILVLIVLGIAKSRGA